MVQKTHADALGLTAVIDERLRTLLRGLHRETLPCPLTIAGLTSHGLQDVAGPVLNHMRGLPHEAVRAVVVAVLAERRMAAEEAAKKREAQQNG
ncbi:MAG: hypothetical protein AAF721_38025 [Myxococcota bacterium]